MGGSKHCLEGYPGMFSGFTDQSCTSFPLDNLDRMHTTSVCGYAGEHSSQEVLPGD